MKAFIYSWITQEIREDLSLISIQLQLNHAGSPCRPATNCYPIRNFKHWTEDILKVLQQCFSLAREWDWQLVCCCHVCTLGSRTFRWKKKKKTTNISVCGHWGQREVIAWNTHTRYLYCLEAHHYIFGSRWSLFKTTYENFSFKKKQIQLDNCCHCNGSTDGRWDKNTHKM